MHTESSQRAVAVPQSKAGCSPHQPVRWRQRPPTMVSLRVASPLTHRTPSTSPGCFKPRPARLCPMDGAAAASLGNLLWPHHSQGGISSQNST